VQRSQLNSRARSRPFWAIEQREVGEVRTRASASRISVTLLGSTNSPASPTNYGSEEMPDVTTGTPAAMACATGNPKPSYSEG